MFICIDDLDEFPLNNLRELLESLRDIVLASPTARMFLSERLHIRDEITRYFAEVIMIAVIPTLGDNRRYLVMRLDSDTIPSAIDCNLKFRIMELVLRKISQILVEITV